MARGGPRPGSGRKPKNPALKALENQPMIVTFPTGERQHIHDKRDIPPGFDLPSREGTDTLPKESDIYAELMAWIEAQGGAAIIPQHLVKDFAHNRRAYLECENQNRRLGRVMGNGKLSPYVRAALEYEREARAIYHEIWSTLSHIRDDGAGEEDDFLQLLQSRNF